MYSMYCIKHTTLRRKGRKRADTNKQGELLFVKPTQLQKPFTSSPFTAIVVSSQLTNTALPPQAFLHTTCLNFSPTLLLF